MKQNSRIPVWAILLIVFAIVTPAPAQVMQDAGVVSVQIMSGTSLSASAVAIPRGCMATAIVMPPSGNWTTANLTFQTSPTLAGAYGDRYDSYGAEMVATAAGGRTIDLDPAMWYWVRYFKIRSGIASSAVNQAATRTLQVVYYCGGN